MTHVYVILAIETNVPLQNRNMLHKPTCRVALLLTPHSSLQGVVPFPPFQGDGASFSTQRYNFPFASSGRVMNILMKKRIASVVIYTLRRVLASMHTLTARTLAVALQGACSLFVSGRCPLAA